jgi:hypothetical protein
MKSSHSRQSTYQVIARPDQRKPVNYLPCGAEAYSALPHPAPPVATRAAPPVARAGRAASFNWPLVAGAGVLTLLILGGLGTAAWAIINSGETKTSTAPELTRAPRAEKAPIVADQFAPRKLAKPDLAAPPEPVPAIPQPEAAPSNPAPEPDVPPKPAPQVFEADPNPPACATYGTSVQFLGNQAEAARLALKEKKLLLVLHISGNFEDSRFT